MAPLVLALHLAANLLWIGSIVAIGALLSLDAGTPVERGKIALRLYQRVANPAFGLSFVMGVVRLVQFPELLHAHFMHAKLTLAVVVIALHHVLGARARKLSAGSTTSAGPAPILAGIIAASALGIVLLLVFHPF